jgi:NAD(P)-dependent dehydrogenase (short-subunit alcohol dehydrogenase family)
VGTSDLFTLNGKVALVTRAGSGLGRQFSEAMAEAGADVACADIDEESAKATAAAVEGLFNNAGIADPEALPLHAYPTANWRAVLDVDLDALAYNAAKGAVVNLTRELGLEYARQGIQVNALCPGFYQTNLSRGAIDDPQARAAVTAFIPMDRIAEASEIKGPALFLASAASDYMTGQTLVVDGGCLAK